MQRVLALFAVAGCASGSGSVTPDAAVVDAAKIDAAIDGAMIDGPMIDASMIDAPLDAMIDAPMIDAPMIDAPMIDAPMIDAPMIDAPMIDAPMIDAPPDACVPINAELLANPALDLSPAGTGWMQTLIDPAFPLITGDGTLAEHSAPFKAWLGGIEAESGTVTDILFQDVVVPANTTQLVLTAYYDVRSGEDPTAIVVYDSAAIDVTQPNGTPIVTVRSLSNLTPTTAWTMVTHTFTPNLAGQTIRVRMTSTNDFFRPTSFYFDTLSLRALHCP